MARKRRRNRKKAADQPDMLVEAGMSVEAAEEGDADARAPADEAPAVGEPVPEVETPEAVEVEADAAASPPEPEGPPEAEGGPEPDAAPEADSTPEPEPATEPEVVPEPVLRPSEDWPQRVAAREDLRDVQGALDIVRAERARVPEDIPLLEAEIRLLGTLGQFEDAESPLRELRRIAGDAPVVGLTAGVLLFRRGKYPEAEAELRAVAAQTEPAAEQYASEATYYLGESLNRMERVDEALDILRRAIALNPDDPRAYSTLGRLLDRKGEPEEAAVMHREARKAERRRTP